VFIHGWGIHAYLWRHNLPACVAAGYRVVALDLPGHGGSSLPTAPGSYSLAALTKVVIAVLDQLAIPRAAIVAQSMGGRVALELALRHPARVSRLMLFGAVGLGEAPRTVALATYLPLPRNIPSTLLVRRWMVALGKAFAYGKRGVFAPEDVDAYWRAAQRPGVLHALRQTLVEFDWRELTAAQLRALALPVVVVFGTIDRTIRPRRTAAMVAQLPQGQLRWISDAGHVANEEVPDEVNPLLLEFIAAGA
jgi:3-oxoadipate enol-lactonase